MSIGDEDNESFSVQLSRSDLALLSNALNEALEAVEDWEFDTRLGATVSDAKHLQQALHDVLQSGSRRDP